jgi:glycosyltransferase involved in cell wall biosynthesis
MTPEVAVVIAVHNGADFLAEALHSLNAQDLSVEVVVVDDGSTDDSGQIARDFGIETVVRQEQQGPAAARNTGIAASSAPLLGFLDADDLIPPGALARQVEHLARQPATSGVTGFQEYLVVDGATLPDWAVADGVGGPEAVMRPYAMGVVARRSTFEHVGGFDPRFRLSQDVDWLFKARDFGHQIDVIDEVIRIRRIHGSNRTYDTQSLRHWQFEVLAARARRKRELL